MALHMWQQQQQQHWAPARRTPGSSSASTSTSSSHAALLAHHGVKRQRCMVTCMAHPRRVAKVASQIQREISEMFIYDKVVQEAICPERRSGMDDQLSAVASVTEVYVSGDLQVVKVYVSVYSDERGKERAISNLKRIAPYVRSRIGQSVRLRLTPDIRFVQDNTLDEVDQIQAAIGKEDFDRYIAEAEAEAAGGLAAPSTSGSSAAAAAAAVAAGFGPGEDDDDSGFFDIAEDGDGEAGEASSGAAGEDGGGDGGGRKVAWSRQDPDTFFAVDEDELAEAEQDGLWYTRAGPFDDLFVGAGKELAQQRGGGGAGGGRGDDGGRGGERAQRPQSGGRRGGGRGGGKGRQS